jgi:hypothetical protein
MNLNFRFKDLIEDLKFGLDSKSNLTFENLVKVII